VTVERRSGEVGAVDGVHDGAGPPVPPDGAGGDAPPEAATAPWGPGPPTGRPGRRAAVGAPTSTGARGGAGTAPGSLRRGFGPSALATPANALSAGRLLAAPVFVGLIATEGASWVTVAVGVAVAGTDGIDGWLARRQGTTTSGAFLDPLADKVLVLGSFFALAAKGTLPWLPVGLMAVREAGMSAYRSWAGRRGVSVPARRSAKVKTLVQELAIATCLVPPLSHHRTLQLAAVWTAATLTISTGVQYFLDGRRGPAATP
jgi:CDP-diacylglycerol--glycerol-3-phosphate 3-phosphatidyltransferase